jgi:predicted cobalt transporter CbtA
MERSASLPSIVKAAVLAALLAGLSTAAFHWLATEPVIEQAIALEEAHAQEHNAMPASDDPVVSRNVQRFGLVLGYALYGVALGLLFGVAYHAGRRLAPGSERTKALWFTATAYVCVGLLPMLKYPANPPGVGDPATIEYRQTLYLALLGMAVLVGGASLLAARANRSAFPRAALAAAVVLLGGAALLYVVLPNNPDASTAPEALLSQFRLFSVLGISLFWAVFGAGFAWLLLRQTRRAGPQPVAA